MSKLDRFYVQQDVSLGSISIYDRDNSNYTFMEILVNHFPSEEFARKIANRFCMVLNEEL